MLRHKTILHIIDTTGPGGAETIFTQLASETAREGFETIALVRGPGWVKSELERLKIETIVLDCKGSFNIKFLKQLINIIKSRDVKVIQSHLLGSNVYASIAGFITRVPVFSTFHGFVDISAAERFSVIKFLAIRWGSKKIIAVTEQIRDMLSGNKWLKNKNIIVIANGVNTDFFDQKSNVNISKLKTVVIGCLGNVRRAKNYPLAIETLKKLIDKGIDAELHIAGDDKNKLADDCRHLANKLGVPDKVVWHGFISNARDYLWSLDVFLLSSSSEGHPLALTQAMSVGLPIVTTACGVEHVVTEGKSALIAQNNNPDDLVNKFEILLSNESLQSSLGANAGEEVRNRWGLNTTLIRYMELYR